MDTINTAIQLALEQALKALIPYLQSLDDPTELWDFLDTPFPAGFLFMAGHEAQTLPDDQSSFLGFISGLPDYRAIGRRYPQMFVRMELGTAGIADPATRGQAVLDHSHRAASLIRLFSPWYADVLRAIFNTINNPDTRPWAGLGIDAWNAEKPLEGASPTGKAFVANPSYLFTVHFEVEPDDWPQPES